MQPLQDSGDDDDVNGHRGGNNQFTAEDFSTALASKEDRKERENMQTGHDKLMAMFVAGVIDDVEKGTLTSVAFSKSTAGYLKCMQKTTKLERREELGRMANSNNANRPSGSVHAVFRDMPVHDDTLMGAFVDGLLPKDPLKDISAKQQQARITAFLPYLKSFAERLEMEKQARDMEDAQGADAAERTKKRTYILVD